MRQRTERGRILDQVAGAATSGLGDGVPAGRMLRDAQSRAESADVDAKRRSRTKGEYHEEKGWAEMERGNREKRGI